LRRSVVQAIGPFPQSRLDKTFGLAVSSGSVGTGEEMAELELLEAAAKMPAAIAAAVVGHDAANGDGEGSEVIEGGTQEGERGAVRLVGEQAGEGDAGVIVDSDVEILPAGAGAAARTQGMVAKLGTLKAAKSFDVEMEQASGLGVLVASGRRSGIESAQAVESKTAQDAAYGGAAEGGVLCDAKAGPNVGGAESQPGPAEQERCAVEKCADGKSDRPFHLGPADDNGLSTWRPSLG